MSNNFQSSLLVILLLALPASAGSWGSGGSGGSEPEDLTHFRIDCRYHGQEKGDKDKDKDKDKERDRASGNGFCYGSAVYRVDDKDKDFKDVHLAIGCDSRTLFNEDARIHVEMTLDRFQPHRAATPAIEVFPHGQLTTEGTYTSVLDISYGRFQGLCYVHKVKYEGVSGKKW